VTGVDFSVGMLDQARRKAAAEGVGNIAFLERDMTALQLPANSFDVAVCAFGIFGSVRYFKSLWIASAGMRGEPLGMGLFKSFDNGGSR
jgi:ubiquinone/menaquinone biosynthesis C-methylase UbiE